MTSHPIQPEGSDAAGGRCADIQGVLFDYLARELGPARSDLVREHLRLCPECRREAAEIQATLDALKAAGPAEADAPMRLTDDRRRRLAWSVMHPVRDWMQRHHALVALVAAVIVLALAAALLRTVHQRRREHVAAGPAVTIGRGAPPPAGSRETGTPSR